MERLSITALLLATLLAVPHSVTAQDENRLAGLEEQAFKETAALLGPSIVQIQTVGGLDRVGGVNTGTAPTTGVIVSADGYIITSAFNFAAKPASTLVIMPDERRLPAEIIATDSSRMLTLLRIEAEGLIPAPAAKTADVQVGQWAIALGRTYSPRYPSFSIGVVSAVNRVWGKAIQTDAKVSPINYGGPLADVEGKVLGILVPLSPRGATETAGVEWYDSGIGFAVPMDHVYAILDRLKAGEELKPGLLGVTFSTRDQYGEPKLAIVTPLSPAYDGGFKSDDVIVEADGKPIGRISDLRFALGPKYAGDEVKLKAMREGQPYEAVVKLTATLPAYEPAFLGILPDRSALSEVEVASTGVQVRAVVPESPAAKAGLQAGDRIVSMGETSTETIGDLMRAIARLQPGDDAKLTFVRADKQDTVDLQLQKFPEAVVADLPPLIIPPPKEPPAADQPKVGRFTIEMENLGHSYWAYVPEHYNPDFSYGLMVWIHPAGDTMEAAITKSWAPLCERRGLIVVAPKAEEIRGWKPGEASFVAEAVRDVTERYSIDPRRVFLHGFDDGGKFAFHLAFKEREMFRGVAAASAILRERPKPSSPDFPLQIHFNTGSDDAQHSMILKTVDGLRKLKFPVTQRTTEGRKDKYPTQDEVEEIGRWADSLDRI